MKFTIEEILKGTKSDRTTRATDKEGINRGNYQCYVNKKARMYDFYNQFRKSGLRSDIKLLGFSRCLDDLQLINDCSI